MSILLPYPIPHLSPSPLPPHFQPSFLILLVITISVIIRVGPAPGEPWRWQLTSPYPTPPFPVDFNFWTVLYSVTEKFISLIIVNFICKSVCNFIVTWISILESRKHENWVMVIDYYKLYTPEKMFVDTYITFLVLKVSLNSTINKIKTNSKIFPSL